MTFNQYMNLGFILFIGILLGVGFLFHSGRKKCNKQSFIPGILLTIFGIVTSCNSENACYELFTFENTAGFGRAFTVGLILILAEIIIFCVCFIKKRKKDQSDGVGDIEP